MLVPCQGTQEEAGTAGHQSNKSTRLGKIHLNSRSSVILNLNTKHQGEKTIILHLLLNPFSLLMPRFVKGKVIQIDLCQFSSFVCIHMPFSCRLSLHSPLLQLISVVVPSKPEEPCRPLTWTVSNRVFHILSKSISSRTDGKKRTNWQLTATHDMHGKWDMNIRIHPLQSSLPSQPHRRRNVRIRCKNAARSE